MLVVIWHSSSQSYTSRIVRNSHIRQNAAEQAYAYDTIPAICSMDNPRLVLLILIVFYYDQYIYFILILCDHFVLRSMHLLCLI